MNTPPTFADLQKCPRCGAHIKRSPQDVAEIQQDWHYWKHQELICMDCYNAGLERAVRRDGRSHYILRVESAARQYECDCGLVDPHAANGWQFEIIDLVLNETRRTPVYATLGGAARCAINAMRSAASLRRYRRRGERMKVEL